VGPIGPTGSFVADLRTSPVEAGLARRHRPRRYLSSLVALGVISLLISLAYFAQGSMDAKELRANPEPDSVNMVGPGFKVYSLGELSRTEALNQVSISFSTTGLPFDFTSLVFGDYETNPVVGTTYYAGSGMILNVSGPGGNVTLKEQNGKVIRVIQYQGQTSIVLNGETVYTSTPTATTHYEGTDILVQDWLKGTWSPQEGVVLERPTGMTIETSEFYLMVFQPPATVPEFGALPIVATVMMIICAMVARVRKKGSRQLT
jgi:hypothetical protein